MEQLGISVQVQPLGCSTSLGSCMKAIDKAPVSGVSNFNFQISNFLFLVIICDFCFFLTYSLAIDRLQSLYLRTR